MRNFGLPAKLLLASTILFGAAQLQSALAANQPKQAEEVDWQAVTRSDVRGILGTLRNCFSHPPS